MYRDICVYIGFYTLLSGYIVFHMVTQGHLVFYKVMFTGTYRMQGHVGDV